MGVHDLGLSEVLSWHRLPAVVQPLFICILLPAIHPLSLWRCFVKWRAGMFDNCKLIELLSVSAAIFFSFKRPGLAGMFP